ncbi:SGNH/GDSL hydrolase family protein [Siansivirga zeaxanthinifaciens]|uniref:Lipase n=1 Tax=Siansivirga zeaxanthinifaciens CC-SAMT-1 TaxID=1454006 RepID=A0A0C5WKU2_9FLAO|nr:hypothetical protein [Siansivirga zeaxanthinifaciens]AJR03435.1 lipase [Siansivirga zeaxanthinifaciens CC-SAMT-1]
MNYQPKKIAFFIIISLLLLFLVTKLSKANELTNGKIQDGFVIGSTVVKFPTTETFLMNETALKEEKIKTVDSILNNIEVVVENQEETTEIKEDLVKPEKQPFIPTLPDFNKIDTSKIRRINYPEDKAAFLNQLKTNLQSGSCRIIHYGDSQIEGDRMSAYIRNRLQNLYNGKGPGFIPIVQAYEHISAVVTPSENWTRHAYFNPRETKFTHKKYGVYNSFSRFTPLYTREKDSLIFDSLPSVQATIKISPSKKSFSNLRSFTNIGLHYGNATAPTTINVYNGETLVKSGNLITDGNYHNFKIILPTTPESLRIELESIISPDFYGVTLDGSEGVSLDNVAMRGSSGTVFSGTSDSNFSQMLNELNPKIVIMQYGGNTVPYLKDSTSVDNYSRYLQNHINWIKRKTSKTNFIFIGPSDMTTTENGQLRTYKLLPYLNKKLLEMCTSNNVAYWSMYDAMGGENSMQHWVDQKLAGTDYTHFTMSGNKLISELFFMSLYLDLTKK